MLALDLLIKKSFDEFLKSVKNKNLSPKIKKNSRKNILIKSPFQKKIVQSKSV